MAVVSATLQHGSLEDLRAAVQAALRGPSVFQVLNTRLIIQLGVDLRAPTAAQNHDASLIRRVEEALRRMGITVGGQPT